MFRDGDSPVVIEAIIATESEETAVHEKWILVQIAMSDVHLQIGDWLHSYGRIHLGKSLIECWHLGINRHAGPRQRIEPDLVEQVGIRSAIIGIDKVDVKISVELKPGDGGVVAARLEPVPYTEPPDRPSID